ncbi:MAG TPA: DUF6152 family protein [Vicinamibacterales bacterium]|nr:DUF6152 family protein [Vicinamibacterales bacterium]
MLRRFICFIALMLPAAVASAHHGFGSFEVNKTVSFNGARLTRIELVNPHSWLYFEWADASGKVQKYRCEMRSSHVLRRSGWTTDLFPANSKVNITASPDREDPNSCYLQTIEFENGSRMDRYGQYVKAPDGKVKEVVGAITAGEKNRPARRPTGEPNISGDWAPEQVVMADPRGTGGGLIPLSQVEQARQKGETAANARGGGAGRGRGAGTGPRLYGGSELTERGTQEAEKFTQKDNPRFQCQTTSILFDWTFDGPVNRITQNRDTIVVQYGQLGLRRTIFMNMKEHPKTVKPSRAGHSIGRWEGDTLVVDTVGFLPGVLNAPVRHSDQLHVVERFTLDPKTLQLRRTYEAKDPVYLKGTYSGQDMIQPADAPYAPGDCKEQQFINYSKQGQK